MAVNAHADVDDGMIGAPPARGPAGSLGDSPDRRLWDACPAAPPLSWTQPVRAAVAVPPVVVEPRSWL